MFNVSGGFNTTLPLVDTTPPVITVSGSLVTTLTVGDPLPVFTDSMIDDTDGNITNRIVRTGDTIDNQTAGTYVRRWNGTDLSGNTAIEVVRIVIYENEAVQIAPTANAGIDQTNVQGGQLVILNGTASTANGNATIVSYSWYISEINLSNSDNAVTTFIAPIDSSSKTYTAVLKVTDNNGLEDEDTVNITVTGVETSNSNIIELKGNSTVNILLNSEYEELGVTTTSEAVGSVQITIDGIVDTSVEYSYTVRYIGIDSVGNVTILERTVIVSAYVDITIPLLKLRPDITNYNIKRNSVFTLPVCTWIDNNNTGIVTPVGSIDTDTLGLQTLTYTYSDEAGNTAIPIIVNVNVYEPSTSVNVETAIASTSFTLEPGYNFTSYAGRLNIQQIRFLPTENNPDLVLSNGYLDFDQSNINKIEIIIGQTVLTTENGSIRFKEEYLSFDAGQVYRTGRYPMTIILYAGNDTTQGIVLAGESTPNQTPYITIY